MTENTKTITIVAVGLLAIVVGLMTRPSPAELDTDTLVGEDLTKHFDSADEAKRLRIVRFDEDTATLREFEVAEQDGLWTIPSKDGYPADAARQMAEAATSLMDRNILAVASESAGDHQQFGVIDPLSPKLEPGAKGVGTRVTMSDVHNEPLADLIVGKAVKDAEGQRYVREAGRDIVYVIEIDPAKLSTNFEDWIEKDLLKLNSWDLAQVEIKDYSAALVQGMTPDGQFKIGIERDPRAEMILAYNETDAKWSPVRLRQFDQQVGDYTDLSLADDEELNPESLNQLKSALDDLQIVDVVRKPQGLSDDLKAGEDFMNNREAMLDLMSRGFTPAAAAEEGPQEIISSDGEVVATMKNGTEYVLRFGNLTNVASGAKDGEADSAGEAAPATGTDDKKPANDSDVHRYLFVMARFNENAVKQPELQALPELPKEEPAAESAPGEPASAGGTENGSDPASVEGTEYAGEPPAASEEAKPGDTGESAAAGEEANSGDTGESTSAEATDSTDKVAAATGEATAKPASEGESDKDKELETIIAERKRIEAENQRKLDEYQELLKKGRENVNDLNLRFGDWYFVIADDVFKKVRLSRENVIKKKEQPQAEGESDAADGTKSDAAAGATIPGLPEIPGANP